MGTHTLLRSCPLCLCGTGRIVGHHTPSSACKEGAATVATTNGNDPLRKGGRTHVCQGLLDQFTHFEPRIKPGLQALTNLLHHSWTRRRLVAIVAVLDAALTQLLSQLRGSATHGPIQHLVLQPPGPVHICFPPMPPGRSTPGPTALAGQRLAPHIDQDATDRQPMMREHAEHSWHGLSPPGWAVTY